MTMMMSKKDACYYGHVVAHAFSPTTRNLIFGAISSVPFFLFSFLELVILVLSSFQADCKEGLLAGPPILLALVAFLAPLSTDVAHPRPMSTPPPFPLHALSLSFSPLLSVLTQTCGRRKKNGGRGLSLSLSRSLSFVKEGGAMQQVCGAGCLSLGLFFF